MPAIFAISSALLYALSSMVTKGGIDRSNPESAVFISLLSCVISSFLLFILSPNSGNLSFKAALFFLGAGILGPLLGRFFLFKGIDRVGVSITQTVYETKPLFSVFAALLLLHESLTFSVAVGMVLMITGAILVSYGKNGGLIGKTCSKNALIFPLLAGACYGTSHVLRKLGLNVEPDPALGVFVQNLSALVIALVIFLPSKCPTKSFIRNSVAWKIFGLAGILQVGGQWFLFAALNMGEVVIVSPLSSLSTFFVLIFTILFLRKKEKVTLQMLFGAVFIFIATVFLTTAH